MHELSRRTLGLGPKSKKKEFTFAGPKGIDTRHFVGIGDEMGQGTIFGTLRLAIKQDNLLTLAVLYPGNKQKEAELKEKAETIVEWVNEGLPADVRLILKENPSAFVSRDPRRGAAVVSPIGQFGGHEADVVILMFDNDDYPSASTLRNDGGQPNNYYLGVGRAKQCIVVIANESVRRWLDPKPNSNLLYYWRPPAKKPRTDTEDTVEKANVEKVEEADRMDVCMDS